MACPELLAALVLRGAIGPTTEIEAVYPGRSLGPISVPVRGAFTIEGLHVAADGAVTFDAVSTVDGARRAIPGHAVVAVDGMALERFAAMVGGIEAPEPDAPPRRPGRPHRAISGR